MLMVYPPLVLPFSSFRKRNLERLQNFPNGQQSRPLLPFLGLPSGTFSFPRITFLNLVIQASPGKAPSITDCRAGHPSR